MAVLTHLGSRRSGPRPAQRPAASAAAPPRRPARRSDAATPRRRTATSATTPAPPATRRKARASRDAAREGAEPADAGGARSARAARPATVPGRRTSTPATRPRSSGFTAMAPRDVNETCLTCHSQGHARASGTAACTTPATCRAPRCHSVHNPKSEQGAAQDGDGDRRPAQTCHKQEAMKVQQHGAHAAARGQDGLHLLPQPARVDQRPDAQGRQHGQRDLHELPRREARAVPAGSRRRCARTAPAATIRTARTTTACWSPRSRCSASAATSAARHPADDLRRRRRSPPPATASIGRGCVNCHSQIHGSNQPAGNKFLR